MVFESLLNPVFSPLLHLSPLIAIIFIAFLVSLIITLVYKYMTNQDEMKRLKQKIKESQKKVKENRHDQKKVMELQKAAMETNMVYMRQSMKPTLITFLPIIIIFGWLNANLAFEPILPGQEFTTSLYLDESITGTATITVPDSITVVDSVSKDISGSMDNCNNCNMVNWTLRGDEGEHLIEYDIDGTKYSKEVLITRAQKYTPIAKKVNDNKVAQITINNKKLKPLNLFGWELGWLGTYIIASLVFSMGLRKWMKLH